MIYEVNGNMELELLSNKKKRHPLRYIVLCAVFVVFMISAISMIASNNKQIKEKQAELDAIKYELSIQDTKNEERRNELDSLASLEESKEIMERIAKEKLDFARPTERIFIIE